MTTAAYPAIIDLNVGGVFYSTALSTLLKDPNSILGQIFTGKKSVLKDAKGRYFLDHDGVLFRYVLDYLRTGRLTLPDSFQEKGRLKAEAERLGMQGLMCDVTALLPRDSASPVPPIQGVITVGYRGTFAFGRDGLADVKFRKLMRILVAGRVSVCRQVFADQLNESRDPDRGDTDYSSRFYLKHTSLEQAFDTLILMGFRLVTSCGSGTNSEGKANQDEEVKWQHYNEFIFSSP